MTIQDLAKNSGVKEKTIITRLGELPGVTKDGDEFVIPDGSRWFFDLHRYKLGDRQKRMDALLAATSRFRYVDAKMLNMPQNSFDTMLNELTDAGLLQPNGSDNPYGANRYDTTMKYDQIKDKESKERIRSITEIVSSVVGKIVGEAVKAAI